MLFFLPSSLTPPFTSLLHPPRDSHDDHSFLYLLHIFVIWRILLPQYLSGLCELCSILNRSGPS